MGKRSVTAEDIFRLTHVGDVVMHPDGQRLAVTVSRMNAEENLYQSHIWMIHTPSGDAAPFTESEKSESAPQWSPDGKWLAFLSNRHDGKQQVFIMPTQGGEAHQATSLSEGVQMFRWSADSKSIAFVGNVSEWAKDEQDPKKTADKTPREKFTEDVKVIRQTWYRMDGVGYFGNRRNHLHVVNVQTITSPGKHSGQATTAPFAKATSLPTVRLTEGPFDIDSFDWSPDGTHVVFAGNLDADADETMHRYLYRMPVSIPSTVDGRGTVVSHAERLFKAPCSVEHPRFSPNGQYIAFYGNNLEHAFYTQHGVWVYDVDAKEVKCLTADMDEAFGDVVITDTRASASLELCWSEHSRHVYSIVSQRGATQLVRIDCVRGDVEWMTTGDHCLYAFSLDGLGSTAAMVRATPDDPGSVFLLELPAATGEASSQRRLTHWNADWLAEVELAHPKRFTFSSGGLDMDGWVMLPFETREADKLPAVLQVHGGPMAMYGNTFFFEFQLIAASGLAVVYSNPRGSMGYGQEFCSCIKGDWGNLDFQDVEACMDEAIAQFPIDDQRLAIAGGSYGGFMSAWAIGHTQRYKAAIVMRACINEYSMFGTCDLGFLDELDFGCKPWENPAPYFAVSPIVSAAEIKADTLIIHSENDLRCPVEQAEQLYAALRAHGVPVEFVRFPNESHGLSRSGKPWHRVFRLEKIQDFLISWVRKGVK